MMQKHFSVFVLLYVGCLADKRIIGGQDAYAGQFPYIVAINVETSDSSFFCGGAIINHQWVISSAHCLYNGTLFTLQMGSNKLTSDDPERKIVSSSEYIVHPDFNPNFIVHDIGLIKLRLPVYFNAYITAVLLPNYEIRDGAHLTTAGWGQTSDESSNLSENLQEVDVVTLTHEECQSFYGTQITENMICAVGNLNQGTCVGDTGGPLVGLTGRFVTIFGISSFISGNGCETPDPSGFTRVFPYVGWINSVIK